MSRVITYVDGFNLYHGLRSKFDRKYLWLDLESLAVSLLKPGQQLVEVRYFTAATVPRSKARTGGLRTRLTMPML